MFRFRLSVALYYGRFSEIFVCFPLNLIDLFVLFIICLVRPEFGERSVLTLGSLLLPSYMRDMRVKLFFYYVFRFFIIYDLKVQVLFEFYKFHNTY